MNSALTKNESKFRVLVLAVAIKMLTDGHSLLDEMVKIFWNIRGQAVAFQNPENLGSRNGVNLRNAKAIPESDANLRRGEAFFCELADVICNVLWLHLQPRRWAAAIRSCRRGDTLTTSIHATHDCSFQVSY